MPETQQPAMGKSAAGIFIAVLITVLTLGLGYASFGFLTMLVFTAGFVGGLVLWLALPSRGTWGDIRWPFWLALVLFFAHRVEEKQLGFFAVLSKVTGVPTPAATSVPVLLLVGTSVGAWLLTPYLMKRRHPLGAYFAWTFFASMGLTELAHYLVFPFLLGPGYHFVPGMLTVPLLAPVAWFGMWRLGVGTRPTKDVQQQE